MPSKVLDVPVYTWKGACFFLKKKANTAFWSFLSNNLINFGGNDSNTGLIQLTIEITKDLSFFLQCWCNNQVTYLCTVSENNGTSLKLAQRTTIREKATTPWFTQNKCSPGQGHI